MKPLTYISRACNARGDLTLSQTSSTTWLFKALIELCSIAGLHTLLKQIWLWYINQHSSQSPCLADLPNFGYEVLWNSKRWSGLWLVKLNYLLNHTFSQQARWDSFWHRTITLGLTAHTLEIILSTQPWSCRERWHIAMVLFRIRGHCPVAYCMHDWLIIQNLDTKCPSHKIWRLRKTCRVKIWSTSTNMLMSTLYCQGILKIRKLVKSKFVALWAHRGFPNTTDMKITKGDHGSQTLKGNAEFILTAAWYDTEACIECHKTLLSSSIGNTLQNPWIIGYKLQVQHIVLNGIY